MSIESDIFLTSPGDRRSFSIMFASKFSRFLLFPLLLPSTGTSTVITKALKAKLLAYEPSACWFTSLTARRVGINGSLLGQQQQCLPGYSWHKCWWHSRCWPPEQLECKGYDLVGRAELFWSCLLPGCPVSGEKAWVHSPSPWEMAWFNGEG